MVLAQAVACTRASVVPVECMPVLVVACTRGTVQQAVGYMVYTPASAVEWVAPPELLRAVGRLKRHISGRKMHYLVLRIYNWGRGSPTTCRTPSNMYRLAGKGYCSWGSAVA